MGPKVAPIPVGSPLLISVCNELEAGSTMLIGPPRPAMLELARGLSPIKPKTFCNAPSK